MRYKPITKAELARQSGVSRTHITLLTQGKRKFSERLADKLADVLAGKPNALPVTSTPLGGVSSVLGGFDSHALPPVNGQFSDRVSPTPAQLTCLLTDFLNSRRQGLSKRTIEWYRDYLNLARDIIGIGVTSQEISRFLNELPCTNGGKHAYYRALKAFYNWLYSPKSGYVLDHQHNPIFSVDPPKVEKKILLSLTSAQVEYLIQQASCVRDQAIISLFVDSGLRLSELANIKTENIDWHNGLIIVWCKGNKEGFAPFGERTKKLLKEWLREYHVDGRLWDINAWGIIEMLKVLREKTGLLCNPHTFRRTFACLLRKQGLDTMTIKDLGRWESLEMVQRYTRSITFQDSLKFYKAPLG